MIEIDKIYNTDCLVGMRDIADHSVDAIICDLPYGTTKNKWDSVIPLDALWAEYRRIVKPRGAIVLFSQQPFTSQLVNSNPKMFKYEWIWVKNRATGMLNSKHAPLKKHENILVFSEGNACPSTKEKSSVPYYPIFGNGQPYSVKRSTGSECYDYKNMKDWITVNEGWRYPVDVLEFKSERGLHPTQKPVKLLEYLIKTYTKEGEIVLDNCIGSGTTAMACINTGRHFIGFEKEKKYYDICCKRINNLFNDIKGELRNEEI